jgi:hypothetical protein
MMPMFATKPGSQGAIVLILAALFLSVLSFSPRIFSPSSVSLHDVRQDLNSQSLFIKDVVKVSIHPIIAVPNESLNRILTRMHPEENASISNLLHAVHLFGPSLQVHSKKSNALIRAITILLDAELSKEQFSGSIPICPTRYGARFFQFEPLLMGTNQAGSQAHTGQALCILAMQGVPLKEKLTLPTGESATVDSLFQDLLATFRMDGEIYWDAITISLYLPPSTEWKDRFGTIFTLQEIATEVLRRPINESACAGIHRLLALAIILRAHQHKSFLTKQTELAIESHFRQIAESLIRSQQVDGSWTPGWHKFLHSSTLTINSPGETSIPFQVLATGHLLEWYLLLDPRMQVLPDSSLERAVQFLVTTLDKQTQDSNWLRNWYCPASHAIRSARILASSTPYN